MSTCHKLGYYVTYPPGVTHTSYIRYRAICGSEKAKRGSERWADVLEDSNPCPECLVFRKWSKRTTLGKSPMKPKDELKKTENAQVFNRRNRGKLKCPICPPDKGENAKRRGRHGAKKPKYKNKRK